LDPAARTEFLVGAVAALGARHDEMITATLAIQDDLPEWLRVTALGDVAGGSACRRYGANAKGAGPARGAKGRRVKWGDLRLFGSPSVVPQLSSVGGFPPDGRQGATNGGFVAGIGLG
jgi:hypothetical protein